MAGSRTKRKTTITIQFGTRNETGRNRKENRTVEWPYNSFQKGKEDYDSGRCSPKERRDGEARSKRASQRLEDDQPSLPVDPVRYYAGEQREQKHRAEVRKLQSFDQQALVGIADGLSGNGPTLGRVFSPVTGIGNERPDPEEQKRPDTHQLALLLGLEFSGENSGGKTSEVELFIRPIIPVHVIHLIFVTPLRGKTAESFHI